MKILGCAKSIHVCSHWSEQWCIKGGKRGRYLWSSFVRFVGENFSAEATEFSSLLCGVLWCVFYTLYPQLAKRFLSQLFPTTFPLYLYEILELSGISFFLSSSLNWTSKL